MRSPSAGRSALLSFLLALGLAGCSNDDSADDGAGDASTAHVDGGGSGGDGSASTDGSSSSGDSGAPTDAAPVSDGGAVSDAEAGALDGEAGTTGGFFIAVGYGGRRVRSVDGTTWTDDQADITNGGDDNYLLRDVSFGGGSVEAAGYRLQRSPDGKTWTETAPMGQWLGGIAYAKGLWVGAGGYGRNSWSADGLTWTDVDDPHSNAYRAIAYGDAQGGRWVAAGDSGQCRYTGDGKTWTDGATVSFSVGDLAYGAGTYVAVGGSDVATSNDGGATWTTRTPFAASVDGVTYGGGQFVVVGSGHAYRSKDGVTWTDSATAGTSGALGYGAGVYIAIDYGGTVRRSADGITFTSPAKLAGNDNAIVRVRYVTP